MRRLLAAAGALVVSTAVAGCADVPPGEPTGALAVVVGARSNMPPVDLDGVAGQVLGNAVDTQARVSFVVADGAPFVLATTQLETVGEDSAAWQASEAENLQQLRNSIASAAARSPEADLLAALGMAAGEIASAPGKRVVLVADSGLSTAGPLDFRRPGLLDADPGDVVASLQAAGSLPDLRGVHLVFQGLGDTAAPQPALSGVTRDQLVELWTAIGLAAGALDVNVERSPLEGEPAPGFPPVSVVSPGGGLTCTANTVVLGGGDVSFQADTAAFQDAAAAAAKLQPIADRMQAAGVTATLTGTTADVGDEEGQRQLSEQRAQAVADLLGGLGVPAERMTVVGLGSDFPGYVQDRDGSGTLDPAAAAQNRKVTIELVGAGPAVCA
ncbi:OmpA family protein [Blastococcus saxobsidens]|uniref:OmpA family protein n=1 Tax=Blastococcus saxobsidens TaxID=138336 RepID=UPI0002F9D19C|nr:OmpA family protein [Blastococcus saxobsidens]